MKLATFESLASIVESVATVVALAAAGWWTFLLFVKKREKYPRARTTHSLLFLGEMENHKLVRLTIKVENLGNVLLDLCKGKVHLKIVRPVPDSWRELILHGELLPRVDGYEFQWPDLEESPEFALEWGKNGYRLEPLESEEFHFDLELPDAIEAIQIYSYFTNITEKRRELGWNCTTVQPIPGGDNIGKQTAASLGTDTKTAGSSEGTLEATQAATRTSEARATQAGVKTGR